MKIGFIGLGKLGMPCAEVMAERGEAVTGYDLRFKESVHIDIADNMKDAVVGKDIVFIAVPTPHKSEYGGERPVSHLRPMPFSYTAIEVVLQGLSHYVSKNQTVALISTVLPGIVRKRLQKAFLYPENLVYNPYLIAMGTVKHDFLNPDMVIMGTQDGLFNETTERLHTFYCRVLRDYKYKHLLGTWEEAESYKIFYNTFISMKLAFVNMIQDVAEELGHMNVDVVTEALVNSTRRILSSAYMKAGMGDGGACHPRDNIALRYLAEELHLGYDLFDGIVRSREVQAERLADKLVIFGNPRIVIVGKSYKADCDLTDGSYSLLVGHMLEHKHGIKPMYYDEDTRDRVDAEVLKKPVTALVGHWSEYTPGFLDTLAEDSIVVDPWRRYINPKMNVVHYGNKRFGADDSNSLSS